MFVLMFLFPMYSYSVDNNHFIKVSANKGELVIILIAIGIKYMLGSVEEKVEYKKHMMPYVLGAFVLFTGSFLP